MEVPDLISPSHRFDPTQLIIKFKIPLLLFITTWLAYFFYFSEFGLYEDDIWFISHSFNQDWPDQWHKIWTETTYFTQGRPFGFIILRLGTFVLCSLGGLKLCYFTAFLIVFFNSLLFYRLLLIKYSAVTATVGALIFLLFPADTTKPLLIHAFTLQISLTTLLLAYHAYGKARLWLSYSYIVLSLINYESAMLPFLLAPLFFSTKFNSRKTIIKLGKHLLVIFLMLFVLYFVRKIFGESRVLEIDAMAVIGRLLKCVIDGPHVMLKTFFLIPEIIPVNIWLTVPFLIASCILFYFILIPVLTEEKNEAIGHVFFLREIGLSIGLILISYLMAFTHYPAICLVGRLTSVHLAATFGGALLVGLIVDYGISLSGKFRQLLALCICLYLSLLVAYGVLIQEEFKLSWKVQKHFWQEVVSQCPDMNQKSIIFVDGNFKEQTKFIESNTWTDPTALEFMFDFPSEWTSFPQVVTDDYWLSQIVEKDGDLIFKPGLPFLFWNSSELKLKNYKVIILKRENEKLVRVTTAYKTIGGKEVTLADKSSSPFYLIKPKRLGREILSADHPQVHLSKWMFPRSQFEPNPYDGCRFSFSSEDLDPYSNSGLDGDKIYIHPGQSSETSATLQFLSPISSLEFDVSFPNTDQLKQEAERGVQLAEVNINITADGSWVDSKYVTWSTPQKIKVKVSPSSNFKISVNKGLYGNTSDGINIKNIKYN